MATRRSRPSSATASDSPTRSSAPGSGRPEPTPSSVGGSRPHLGRIRQIEVGAAARADLDVELHDVVAGGAAAFRLGVFAAIEDRRDQAEQRQYEADQEPDEEGTALAAAHEPRGEAEEEGDQDVGSAGEPPRVGLKWPRLVAEWTRRAGDVDRH